MYTNWNSRSKKKEDEAIKFCKFNHFDFTSFSSFKQLGTIAKWIAEMGANVQIQTLFGLYKGEWFQRHTYRIPLEISVFLLCGVCDKNEKDSDHWELYA